MVVDHSASPISSKLDGMCSIYPVELAFLWLQKGSSILQARCVKRRTKLTVSEASDAGTGTLSTMFELSLKPRNSSVAKLPPGRVSPVSVSARPFPRTDWRTLRL